MAKLYDGSAHSIVASLESLDGDRLIQDQASLSMFQSEESEPESDHSSTPWSPPAWRKGTSGWSQRHNLAPPGQHRQSNSRTNSRHFSYDDEGDDTLLPSRIPLPASPEKETPIESRDEPDSARTTRSPSAFRHDRSRRNTSALPEQNENCMLICFDISSIITNRNSYPICCESRHPPEN